MKKLSLFFTSCFCLSCEEPVIYKDFILKKFLIQEMNYEWMDIIIDILIVKVITI